MCKSMQWKHQGSKFQIFTQVRDILFCKREFPMTLLCHSNKLNSSHTSSLTIKMSVDTEAGERHLISWNRSCSDCDH